MRSTTTSYTDLDSTNIDRNHLPEKRLDREKADTQTAIDIPESEMANNIEEITLKQASISLLTFAAPLIARSCALIANGVAIPILISQFDEKILAAYSEVATAEAGLHAIYISGAHSVPPLVGMLSRLIKNTTHYQLALDAQKACYALDNAQKNSNNTDIALAKKKLKALEKAIKKQPITADSLIEKVSTCIHFALAEDITQAITTIDTAEKNARSKATEASIIIQKGIAAHDNYNKVITSETMTHTLQTIGTLLDAGVIASLKEHERNSHLKKVKNAIYDFLSTVNNNDPTDADKLKEKLLATKKLADIENDTTASDILNKALFGLSAFIEEQKNNTPAYNAVKRKFSAQYQLDNAKKSVETLKVILSNWQFENNKGNMLEDWTPAVIESFNATLSELDNNLVNLPSKQGLIFKQSMIYAAGLGTSCAIASWFMPDLFKLLGQPTDVINSTNDYFKYASFGYMLDTFYRMQLRFTIGQSIRKTALFSEIFDVSVQLTLSYTLLFHTSLGLASLALAYSLSKITTLLAHTLYLVLSETQRNFKLFSGTDHILQPSLLKKLVMAGLPICVDSFIDTIRTNIVTTFCGLKGTKGLVAMQASGLYATADGFPMGAICQAMNTKIGEYQESFNSRNVITYGKAGMLLLSSLALTTLPIALFMPQYIAGILIDKNNPKEHDDYQMAIKFLRIEGVLTTVTALLLSLQSGLSGLMDNTFPMMTTLATGLILNVGLASTAAFAMKADESYIYASQVIGFILATAILSARWIHQSKHYQLPNTFNETKQPTAAEAGNRYRAVGGLPFVAPHEATDPSLTDDRASEERLLQPAA